MKFIETTEVSEDCIFYLKEVQKEGGEISRGNMKQDHLTAPSDDLKVVSWIPSRTQEDCDLSAKLRRGMNEARKHKFLLHNPNYEYIRYYISERGYELLKQSSK